MKKHTLGLVMAFALMGCTAQHSGQTQPLETWRNYAPNRLSQVNIGEQQGLLVFYREDDVQGNAVNLYINGNYQTSLLENAFTPVVLCAGSQNLSVSFSSNQGFGNRTEGKVVRLNDRDITYVKLAQQSGKLTFDVVPNYLAKEVVEKLSTQNQTISRLASKACGNVQPELLSTEFKGLFKFDRSGILHMQPEDNRKLAKFIKDLNQYDQNLIDRINVNGYTDPEGTEAYNQALSQKRAEALAAKLKSLKVSYPIQVMGHGERDLIVKNCAELYPHQATKRHECNQPNRRVEVKVYGKQLWRVTQLFMVFFE